MLREFHTAVLPSGRPSYSHSALEMYLRCSEQYRLHYLDRDVPRPMGATEDMLVGQILHSVLETYYTSVLRGRSPPPEDTYSFLERYWRRYFESVGLKNVYSLAQEYCVDYDTLLRKASKEYTGDDAIRTKDGSVPKNPMMTEAWARMAEDLGLPRRKEILDAAVSKRDPSFVSASVVAVFRETFKIFYQYVHPKHIASVDAVEISLVGVRYPSTGKAVTGFIDLVGRTPEGDLIIVDHKTTSRTHRDGYKAGFSDQLLLYGWAYYEKFNKIPEYIAINFLRSNTLVSAPFSIAQARESIDRRELAIKAILLGVFVKHSPTDFASPCYNENSKRACPYLSHCHPRFYEHVREKIHKD